MKQRSPVHFVAGFFEAVTPNARRMRRKTERCGVLSMPHAAPVHRFDMHAPERPKSNRFAIRARAITIASRPGEPPRLPVLRLPFQLFWTRFLQVGRTFAQILRAQQMPRPLLEHRNRELAPTAVFLCILMTAEPGRNVCRSVRVVGLCPGAAERHRRFSTAAEKAENPKWNENTLSRRSAETGLAARILHCVGPFGKC